MTNSDEKFVESWDDVRDRFNDLLKRPIDRFVWHRGILQRYKEGRLEVHLHWRINSIRTDREGRVVGCCVCNDDHRGLLRGGDMGVVVSDSPDDVNPFNVAHGQGRQSMLIAAYEEIQQPERLIPSLVRLNGVNFPNDRCGNLIPRQTMRVLSEPLRVNEQGKGWLVLADGRRLDFERREFIGQLPDDVIEGGHQVRQTIADKRAESQGWIDGDSWRDFPLQFTLLLGDDFVRVAVDVGRDLIFEECKVFLCPDDFEPRTI